MSSHRASLEGQRRAGEYSVLHDRGKHWRRRASVEREERAVARGLRRHHDERGRRRDLLFPLHAVPAKRRVASETSCGSIENYKVLGYPPQYLAAQVITKEWVQPIDAPHKQFKAASDVNDAAGNVMVTAYAVERPGRTVVGDAGQSRPVQRPRGESRSSPERKGSTTATSQARWTASPSDRTSISGIAKEPADMRTRTVHPSKSKVDGGAEQLYQLPKASITVLRGRIGE